MAEQPRVIRRPVMRSECKIMYEEGDWAIWFAPNRRVGKDGMYGGPSLLLLRLIVDGDDQKTWQQIWRKDMFGLKGFGPNVLSNHEHDNPASLDDPDHDLYIQTGEDPVDVLIEDYAVPGRMANKLDLTGRSDIAKVLPFAEMKAAASLVRNTLKAYCSQNGIEWPLSVG